MKFSVLASAVLLSSALAHPETLTAREVERRVSISKRCAPAAAQLNEKRYAKRMTKRWAGSGKNTTYQIAAEAPYYDVIQNDTCVLRPIVTEGPYIWPRAQTLRQDMSEGQAGVPLWLDIGVLDMATCEPLENVLLNFWHCNATGSYSSFTALSPDTPFETLLAQKNITNYNMGVTDLHTDDTTFLRGLWPTNSEGVMEMKTIFPGFYVQRAIHIHVQAYTDWTLHDNGTVSSGNIVSTGQLYFDEALEEQIMALDPYATHTAINRATNADDSVFPNDSGNSYNPVMSIVAADGVNVENGMIGYITMAIDTTADGVDNSQFE